MKDKVRFVAIVVVALFSVLAGVGIVSGCEWRLLLVPLAIVPLLRMIGAMAGVELPVSEKPASEGAGDTYGTALGDCVHAGVASMLAEVIARNLGCGRCFWAPGAVTAAATLPLLSGKVHHSVLRMVCLFAAGAYFAFAPFVFVQDLDMVQLGSVFTMFVYVPTRLVLVGRALKRGRAEA